MSDYERQVMEFVLVELEELLSQTPHVDRFCTIARQYVWLLEFTVAVLARLIDADANARKNPATLSVLIMATHADHIREVCW